MSRPMRKEGRGWCEERAEFAVVETAIRVFIVDKEEIYKEAVAGWR